MYVKLTFKTKNKKHDIIKNIMTSTRKSVVPVKLAGVLTEQAVAVPTL